MVLETLSRGFGGESIHESPLAVPYAVFLGSLVACLAIRIISLALEISLRVFSGGGSAKRPVSPVSSKSESLLRRENSIASGLSSTSASASATSDVETESSSSFYSPHFSVERRRVAPQKIQPATGYQQWCRMRESWLKPDERRKPVEPGPFNYMEVYETLSQDRQRAELPQRVKLGDILEVYQDIWDRGELST